MARRRVALVRTLARHSLADMTGLFLPTTSGTAARITVAAFHIA
jgi:hypothetical protein